MRKLLAVLVFALLLTAPALAEGPITGMPHDEDICPYSMVPPYQVCTEDPFCFCFWEYVPEDDCYVLVKLICV